MKHLILPGNTGLLLGIGGSGMSSLAHILLDMGFVVYGYDKKNSEVTEQLASRGAFIFPSLDQIVTKRMNFVIFSSAVNDKNHEIFSEVSQLNIPMYHRSAVLHKIFSISKSISVAGSHGKTSTTAMTAQILEESKKDPTVMIGGDTDVLGKKGGKFGTGEWGVYESDESDGTFLKHKADIRLITNIDNDHLDYYHSLDKLQLAFLDYLSLESKGIGIVQGRDVGIKSMLKLILGKFYISDEFKLYIFQDESKPDTTEITDLVNQLLKKFGEKFQSIPFHILEGECSFTYDNINYSFRLPFSGDHYLTNALCAIFAAYSTGINITQSISILSKYSGVKRRQELLGIKNGIKVIDDYGHHPTEIRTVIDSLKKEIGFRGKLVVIFQPHRYSRTSLLQKDLAESLEGADRLFLLPIYSAGENLIPGISAASILQHLKNQSSASLLDGNLALDIPSIQKSLTTGDMLLCIGAGNVRDWGVEYLK